jgi:hypothetical protein
MDRVSSCHCSYIYIRTYLHTGYRNYIRMEARWYPRVYKYIHTYNCWLLFVCVQACKHVCIIYIVSSCHCGWLAFLSWCFPMRTHPYISTHVIYVHIYIQARAHTHIQIHTHARTHTHLCLLCGCNCLASLCCCTSLFGWRLLGYSISLYVRTYVSIWVRVYICRFLAVYYFWLPRHVCVCVCISQCVYVCMYVCTNPGFLATASLCMYVCVCVKVNTCMCVYVCLYVPASIEPDISWLRPPCICVYVLDTCVYVSECRCSKCIIWNHICVYMCLM